jgi:tRNA-splicing ligase RtcB
MGADDAPRQGAIMKTYPDITAARAAVVRQGDAEWLLPVDGRKPIRIIANDEIIAGFNDPVFEQMVNVAEMPGAEQVIITPDAHPGFGCCVGCTVVSESHVYPPIVGPDALCSMSLLQTDLPESALVEKSARRALINAITERIPTGMGNRQAPKARKIADDYAFDIITASGASDWVLRTLGIPLEWATRLENRSYGEPTALFDRFRKLPALIPNIRTKLSALASVGSGNHFLSGDIARLWNPCLNAFGLRDGCLSFLTHCGSRGFGYQLMALHERALQAHFEKWSIPFPAGDKHLVYAPLGTEEADNYLADLALAANFAIINHLLINLYALEAVQEVFPGAKGELIYHISHNIGQEEIIDGRKKWVFRKGATRAFPGDHPGLKDTQYASSGHPILLPGNARDGSVVMVAQVGAAKSCYTVSHGAGRTLGRKQAKRELKQAEVDQNMLDSDVLFNGRAYPLDEAPAAYKDFDEVTRSVEQAGLAVTVAKLQPRFVIKDNEGTAEGSA